MKVFLSFDFNHGEDLTRAVERLLASHDVGIITGRRLGGEQVDESVKQRILEADALVSLVTRRDQLSDGGWTTSQAVLEELSFARDQKFAGREKRAIALIEVGVKFQSMSKNETIAYQRDKPLEAILALSETISKWRLEIGQELKVQILPSALAERLAANDQLICSHRFVDKDIATPWRDVIAIPEEDGTFVYLRGVRSAHRIQLRVKERNTVWQSPAKSPLVTIQLKETPNG